MVHTTSKIAALVKLGKVTCAPKPFDEMPKRDTVVWNTMLTSYTHFGSGKLCYGQKIHALILSAGYSSSLLVNNALIDMYGKCLSPCSAHDVFEEIELIRNNVSWCSLLFAYVNSNQFQSAQSVFEAMPNRVNIAWNTLIAGHARHSTVNSCVDLFTRMMIESCDQIQDQ
ncbi:unnamed protein product [Lactuca virosa]|uniref:Pentatricopeptide repeat-containing protein n=1 Tax=Lactuca virosa TaxID=75947 RepID=A0AAU9NSF7_9ASTR|nr:unnamed protein product [Lactuca virosa]